MSKNLKIHDVATLSKEELIKLCFYGDTDDDDDGHYAYDLTTEVIKRFKDSIPTPKIYLTCVDLERDIWCTMLNGYQMAGPCSKSTAEEMERYLKQALLNPI